MSTHELPEGVDFERLAAALLTSVLQNFLAQLDPSAAVNVADFRAAIRHGELSAQIARLQSQFEQAPHFETSIRQLPQTLRPRVEALVAVDPGRARLLLTIVTDPETLPATGLDQLFVGPEPAAFNDAPAAFWLLLADLCATYGLRKGEALALEKASVSGVPNRARVFARLAMSAAGLADPDAAARHLQVAKELGAGDPIVAAVDATLGQDSNRILASTENLPYLLDGIAIAIIRALALVDVDRFQDALDLLESANAEYPEWTASLIWQANILLSLSTRTRQGDTRRREAAKAFDLAQRARDLRRRWRGPSGECVEVMARAAVTLDDRRLALQVCLPEKDATPDEANWPAVLETAVGLLLDAGQTDRAIQLCARIESPFHQLLAKGALASEGGNRPEAEDLLRQALDLARHEGERRDVIGHMAAVGVWPLPDLDAIRDRRPADAALLEAISFLVRGDPARAITVLRPIRRDSSRVARTLATAYEKVGEIDNSIAELQDAARFFRDPELSAIAALTLADTNRMEQAVNVAQRAAIELPADSSLLPKLRILLVNGFGLEGRWDEAEEQARRLLELEPTSAKAGWALVFTLVRQSKLREAWDAIVERRLEPDDEDAARAWVGLASRYRQAHEWAEKALSLVYQYPASELLHALVLFSFTRHPDPDLPAEVGGQITNSWKLFLERFPDSTILRPHVIGDSDEEIVQSLRRLLEPGAEAALQQSRAVQDGRLPIGVIATTASHGYIATWVAGGAGTLPIYIPIEAINDQETAAVALASNGEVVLDGSALAILSIIQEVAPRLLAVFARHVIPTSLRQDAVRSFDDLVAPSEGYLGWNPETERLSRTEIAPECCQRVA